MVRFRRRESGQPLHGDAAPRRTLAETDRGRALRCEGCGRVQVRFGNAVWVREPEGLRRFRRSLERQAGELGDGSGDGDRELYLTFGNANAYRFRADEVPELRRLLRGACAELAS